MDKLVGPGSKFKGRWIDSGKNLCLGWCWGWCRGRSRCGVYYVHLATWPSSLFRTVSGSMVHIRLATVETAVTLHELGPFLGGQGSTRAVSLLDVVHIHRPRSVVLLWRSVLSVGFLVYTAGLSVIFPVAWEVGCIVSFGHLHEFSQGLLPFVD